MRKPTMAPARKNPMLDTTDWSMDGPPWAASSHRDRPASRPGALSVGHARHANPGRTAHLGANFASQYPTTTRSAPATPPQPPPRAGAAEAFVLRQRHAARLQRIRPAGAPGQGRLAAGVAAGSSPRKYR